MSDQCEAVQPWLSAYLDEELDARRQAEVQAHLASCDVCRREVATLRQTAQAMQAWCVPEVNPQLSVVFAERLRARHSPRAHWNEMLSAARPRLAWLAGGVLVLALLLGLCFIPHQTRQLATKDHPGERTQFAANPVPAPVYVPKEKPYAAVATNRPDATHTAHLGMKHQRRMRSGTHRHEVSPTPTDARKPVSATGPAPMRSPAVGTPATSDINDLAIALITETPPPADAGAGQPGTGHGNETGTPSTGVHDGTTHGSGNSHLHEAGPPPLIEASTDESPEGVLMAYMTETN